MGGEQGGRQAKWEARKVNGLGRGEGKSSRDIRTAPEEVIQHPEKDETQRPDAHERPRPR